MKKIICLFFGHPWKVVDDFYATSNNWRIIECDRCYETKLDR